MAFARHAPHGRTLHLERSGSSEVVPARRAAPPFRSPHTALDDSTGTHAPTPAYSAGRPGADIGKAGTGTQDLRAGLRGNPEPGDSAAGR